MAERVNTSYHRPCNLIPFRWASSGSVYTPAAGGTPVNPFSVSGSVNPNTAGPNSGPLPPSYGTCLSGIDGNTTIALTAGFTPSMNVIVWEWNRLAQAWFKLGAAASLYQTTFDATYAQSTFLSCEAAVLLIQSSAAVTGNAYTDGLIQPATAGTPLQGVT
jgi:hypothetical protein